jgi:hypothetical protein
VIIMTITDKITPQLRKRFSQEVKKTVETGKERGFHMCIEDNGKLSAGGTCTGDECSLKFQNVDISCPGKKVQGDFHTHPYLVDVRKSFGITFKTSDKLIRSATEIFLERRGLSPTIPSHADLRSAVLGKCSKRTEGTTCIGSDLDYEKVECWTIRQMDDGDCVRALMEYISPENEEQKLPKDWIKPLFETEMIRLKRG